MPQERQEKRIDELPTLASVAASVNLPGEFDGVAYKFTAKDFKDYAGGDTILSEQDTDGFYINRIVDGGGGSGGGGGSVTVDDALSATSENPVQNKVIKAALDGKSSVDVVPASASINSSGVFSFANSNGDSVFSVQLPLYTGGVS